MASIQGMKNWLRLTFLFIDTGILASMGNAPLPEFAAVAGSTAQIPCLVPERPPESGIKCIFWYKDDEVMSVYTVDAREGVGGLHVPSDKLRSRATFNPSPWPPMLKMESVKEEDAGVYYCRVDYRWDRTYMYSTVLKVIVPPKKLAILNEYDDEVIGTSGPYLEGQSMTLTCEAIGGKPSPFLSWWKGPMPLKSKPQSSAHGVVRRALTFTVGRNDFKSVLTCRSENNNITAPKMVAVQLELYLKPLDVHMYFMRASLSAGRKTEIRCHTSGSHPPARISWLLDNEPLSNHTDVLSVDGNRTSSILSFWPSRSDHKKMLRCRTENFILAGTALEDRRILNITYIPYATLSVRSSSKRSSFYEGDDARFSCEVKSNPASAKVGWRFQGQILSPEDPDPEIIISYRSLLVRRVQKRHRGRYQCFAQNSEGTGYSREINLSALYAPVCRTGQKTTHSVAIGDQATIECLVEADPGQVTFQWSFSNAADRHYNVSYTSGGTRSVATYTPREVRDFGTLYCWGTNSVGEQQTPCIFTIIPLGPPESLKNCSATNVSVSSVAVVCNRGSRWDPDLLYNLEMYMYDSPARTFLTNRTSPVFIIKDLPSDTKILFAVYAVNVNGRSPPVLVKVHTLKMPIEQRVYHERNPSAWVTSSLIICGAFCCFILVSGIALWTRFHGGLPCYKWKELPKQMPWRKDFSMRNKSNKNYIDRLPEDCVKNAPYI